MSCDWLDDAMFGAPPAAVEAHLAGCEHCRAQLQRDGKIATLIARGATSHQLPPNWKQRTLARVRAAQRARKRRIATLSLLGASAAAAIAVLALCPPERGVQMSRAVATRPTPVMPGDADAVSGPRLALVIRTQPGRRGADAPAADPQTPDRSPPVVRDHRPPAHPGEELRAKAILTGAAHVALRVYRGQHLVVACPDAGDASCLAPDRTELAWTIPTAGSYQVILLESRQPIAPPRGSLDDDVAAATAGGARLVGVEDVDVR